jgi:hypothetical protein
MVRISSGVVDSVFIDNQGVSEGTDLDETIPINARPYQVEGFETQNSPQSGPD